MSTIRVLIAYERDAAAMRGIVATLSRLPDFHLVGGRMVSHQQVEPLVKVQPVDVVVLVGDGAALEELGERLTDRGYTKELTVVRLTIVPPTLHIAPSVGEFGIAHLIDTLRAIGRYPRSTMHARLIRRKLTLVEPVAEAAGERGFSCLAAVRLWLNALLKSRIARERSGQIGDLPGLTIGRDTAVRLLDEDFAQPKDDPEISSLWTAVEVAVAAESETTPLAILFEHLALTEIERKALLLCLAPELDMRFQRALGYLNDDYSRRHATLGLVCSLLGDPPFVRAALTSSNRLRRWRLIESGPGNGWTAEEPLRLDRALLGWVLDHWSLLDADPQLRHAVCTASWMDASLSRADDTDQAKLAHQLATSRPGDQILLAGGEPHAWRVRSEAAVAATDAEPIAIEVARLSTLSRIELEDFAVRAARAIKLLAPVPIVDAGGASPELLAGITESVIPEICAAARHPLFIIVDVPERCRELFGAAAAILERSTTSNAERSEALANAAMAVGATLRRDEADRIARTYALPESGAAFAVRFAQALVAAADADRAISAADVAAACRRIASPNLPSFAHRLESPFSLTDVVLPDDRHRQLREIIAHVHHAATVLDQWGFADQMPRGRGVAALFSGPSGTGKSMAALACARELQSEICVVDLAQVPSKYIGETNKNLETVFSEAERSGVVLLFDEADALFGKRSEVKDSHDRYANIEVAYLLQRIEMFAGLAILTTNFRQNIDNAFLRRFRFTIEFPLPDAAAREAIWRKCLPADAPLAHDVDLRFIARRLQVSGGNIRQITLRAAFAAAAAGTAITMRHLVEATRAELVKIGMHHAERELAERVA